MAWRARFAVKPLSRSVVVRMAAKRTMKPPSEFPPVEFLVGRPGKRRMIGSPLPRTEDIKAVLFDIDGTLCNSDPVHFRAFQQLLAEEGYDEGRPITHDFFKRHISGRHNPDIARDLFPDWDEPRRTAWSLKKEATFRAMAEAGQGTPAGVQRVTGLQRLLDWCESRGLRRAAVTNAPRANAEFLLASVGLGGLGGRASGGYFDVVILGEECRRAKPYPDPYVAALAALGGLSPGEAFAVEDSPSGVASAVAAALGTMGVTTTQGAEELHAAGACVVVADFDDPRLYDGLEGRLPPFGPSCVRK